MPIVVWGFSPNGKVPKFKWDDFDQRKLSNGSQGSNFAKQKSSFSARPLAHRSAFQARVNKMMSGQFHKNSSFCFIKAVKNNGPSSAKNSENSKSIFTD
jgi:hypothetical protein